MKSLLATVALGFIANAAAETLSLAGSLRLELAPGWVHGIETPAPIDNEFGDRISIHHPDGVGILRLQTYTAPVAVSDETLRRLTNVPMDKSLVKGQWGPFSGYQHDYVENNLFHRTWWLSAGDNVVFITYECGVDQRDFEIDQIEAIVQSLTSVSH